MLACEVTLALAGRSDVLHVRGALDAVLAHWKRPGERRGRTGCTSRRNDIAPYYFLTPTRRPRARSSSCRPPTGPSTAARLAEKLEGVRAEETGLWNDRVFKRSPPTARRPRSRPERAPAPAAGGLERAREGR
jgi:hypothetical protein